MFNHGTPEIVLSRLADIVAKIPLNGNEVSVLDLFAGDGRLGKTVHTSLESTGIAANVTYVEGFPELWSSSPPADRLIVSDVFAGLDLEKFELVVTNPPYSRITKQLAAQLGLKWEDVIRGAYNLYGMGIQAALSHCVSGGTCVAIAPFGWVNGAKATEFRSAVGRSCSVIEVHAFESRTLFEDVEQDIAIQIFKVREHSRESETKQCKIRFGVGTQKKTWCLMAGAQKNHHRLRIGPVVWNRRKKHLHSDAAPSRVPLIYGSNIRQNGSIQLDHVSVKERQYIDRIALANTEIYRRPMILVRRVMQGSPGKWSTVSALVDAQTAYAVENHVVMIGFPTHVDDGPAQQRYHKFLIERLERFLVTAGHPNISVRAISAVVAECEDAFVP